MRVPFQINSNGNELIGILHIPDNQQKIPIVLIMCYGLNGNRSEQHRMSVKLGELCEKNAINLVRFDYADTGMGEGNFFFTDISRRVRNVVDICNFVSGCFGGNLFVYLAGFSDGAKTVINAKEYMDNLQGIILWNPIINIQQESPKEKEISNVPEKMKFHKKYKKPYKQLFGLCMNPTLVSELKYDKSVDKLNDHSHKLFVFGEEDRFTKEIRAFIEKRQFYNSSIHIIKAAGHLFGNTMMENQVNEITVKWIQEQVNRHEYERF